MSRNKHILPLISTVIIAFLIIYTGYRVLAKAGTYLTTDNNNIVSISPENGQSYVFYSQADNDIVLFPWNYSNNAVSFTKYYDSSIYASDIINTVNLYEYLRYYFYRIIPEKYTNYIFSNDLSLAQIMDFDNLEKYITFNQGYYFYSKMIDIYDSSFYLSTAFNSRGYIYTFQCREIRQQTEYSTDIMNKANSDLTEFLNDNSMNYLGYLLKDIYELYGILDNYMLNTSYNSYSRLNFKEDIYYYEKNPGKSEIFTSSQLTDDYSDESSKYPDISYSTNNSYQLVKAQYEYLVIMTDLNIIVHYDPVSHIFNGFNIIQ